MADLRQDPNNANKGTVRGRGMLEQSLQSYGAGRAPVASADGVILAGNKTVEVAQELGIPVREIESDGKTLFVIRRTDLPYDDPRARELAIADNRVGEVSLDWSPEVLAALADDGVDLSSFWFEDELADVLAAIAPPAVALTDPDAVPEPPAEPITKPGDLWLLGDHRLLCGDSTLVTDVDRLIYRDTPCACVTDPPYGQSQPGVTNDAPESLTGIINGFVSLLPVSIKTLIAFQSPRTFPTLLDAARLNAWRFERMLWLYKKAQNAYPWRGWLLKSEAILAFSRDGGSWNDVHPYTHDTYDLVEVSGELSEDIGWHGSVKPIAVVADIVQRVSPPDGLIYDPFLGSGTTLIACEQTGRTCYGMEIDPKYCDVIVRRWEDYTGQTAQRAVTAEAAD